MKKLHCEVCGAPLPAHQGRGQPQRFCSNACKQLAHRQRNNSAGTCEYCGAPVEGNERFCSDRCYYYGHKGNVPFEHRDMHAYNEELIPFVPMGQIKAFNQKLAAKHRRWKQSGRQRDREGGEDHD